MKRGQKGFDTEVQPSQQFREKSTARQIATRTGPEKYCQDANSNGIVLELPMRSKVATLLFINTNTNDTNALEVVSGLDF